MAQDLRREANRTIGTRLKTLRNTLSQIGKREVNKGDAFHKTRVLTRKIQAGLTSFRPILPKKVRKKINEEVRELRRSAAEVRDLDVCHQLLEEAKKSSGPAISAIEYLEKALEDRHKSVITRFQKACEDSSDGSIWDKWRKRLDKGMEEEAPQPTAKLGIEAFGLLSVQTAWAEVLSAYETFTQEGETDEDLHSLRKMVKRFRYTVEMFPKSLEKKDRKIILESCKKVQDALGQVTDTLLLRNVVCREEIRIKRANTELRQSFTHLHQWLDDRELDHRTDFRGVWHEHFVPLSQFSGKRMWPLPEGEATVRIPEDHLN